MVEEVPVAWLLEIDYPNFMDKRLKNVVTTAIGVHDTFGTVSFG
jgi:peptide/nickel transport system substrate-binding protein